RAVRRRLAPVSGVGSRRRQRRGTMNTTEAMERIEAPAFTEVVNVTSDFRTFLRLLPSQPEVAALAAAPDDNLAPKLLARVEELTRGPIERGYVHPADVALAAYLWLLSTRDAATATTAAETVLAAKQCWWARQMAEYAEEVL